MEGTFVRFIRRPLVILSLGLLLVLASSLLIISYRTLCFFIYPRDVFKNGKLQSEVSSKVRARLLAEHGAKEVRFATSDNVELAGLFIARTHAKGNLLVCHGYRRTKEHDHHFVTLFPDYNIFLFDFRAHGQSGGQITTIGGIESLDVRAAMHCFMRQVQSQNNALLLPRFILGTSMGAAAALKAAVEDVDICDGIIADSSYADLYEEIRYVFAHKSGLPTFPFLSLTELLGRWLVRVDFNDVRPVDYIVQVSVPVLILHSTVDDTTPPQEALRLFAQAKTAGKEVRLSILPPCRHAYGYKDIPAIYQKKVSQFCSSVNEQRIAVLNKNASTTCAYSSLSSRQ